MKRVDETPQGRAISAFVIMKGKRKVATVQMRYGSGGGLLVNVFQDSDAAERSAMAAHQTKIKGLSEVEATARDMWAQSATAGGYGYDKSTAALSGMWIDGHQLTDHCSRKRAPKPPRGRTTFSQSATPRRGYSFANFTTFLTDGDKPERIDQHKRRFDEAYAARVDAAIEADQVEKGYTDCYRESGLKYLEAMGYTVIQAI